jgi:hypothetical protein
MEDQENRKLGEQVSLPEPFVSLFCALKMSGHHNLNVGDKLLLYHRVYLQEKQKV